MDEPVAGWLAAAPFVVSGLATLSCLAVLYGWRAMTTFMQVHTSIDTLAALWAYQQLVTKLMFLALLMMVLLVVTPLSLFGAIAMGADSGAFALLPMILPMFFIKRARATEGKLRALPVAEPLQDAFAAMNRVWIDRALPRFAPLPTSIDTSAREIRVDCATHGSGAGGRCNRCGTFYCVPCARESSAGSLCGTCMDRYREAARTLAPSFRANFVMSNVLGGIGLADVVTGVALADDPIVGAGGLFKILIGLGVLTLIATTLWSASLGVGRVLSAALAVPHLLLVPIGTIGAIATLWVAFRHQRALSSEASEVARATNTNRTAGIGWAIGLGALAVLLHVGALIPFMMGASFALARAH